MKISETLGQRQLLSNFTSLLGIGKLGIVGYLNTLTLGHPDPSWYMVSCKLNNSPVGEIYNPISLESTGTSLNYREALLRCMGETIERYSLFNAFKVDDIKWEKIDEEILNKFPKCGPNEKCQDSFKGYRPTNMRPHTLMKDLFNGNFELIPIEYVFLQFNQFLKKEDLLTMPITTGAAFNINLDKALVSGICEIIERDAYMLMWLCKIPPYIINIDSSKEYELLRRVAKLRSFDINVRLFDITQDIKIPTIICILVSKVFPYYSVGISCNTNPVLACLKSIDEAISLRMAAKWKGSDNMISYNDFSWITTLEDHMHLYANWDNSPAFNFIFNSINKVDINDLSIKYRIQAINEKEQLDHISRHLDSLGLKIYYKDVTSSDLSTLGKTVKVVIPQAIPISQSYNVRWLNSTRIKNILNNSLNHYPHPFS